MIAIDTNVLVRFLTRDDPKQWAVADEVMASLSPERPGFICREVIIELVWVLERAYQLERETIATTLTGLLEAAELVIEAADRVGLALSRYAKGGAGFSDHMIRLAAETHGAELVSFDRKLARESGVRLI